MSSHKCMPHPPLASSEDGEATEPSVKTLGSRGRPPLSTRCAGEGRNWVGPLWAKPTKRTEHQA